MTAKEWVGQTIAGKYRVEGLLGKGGMGVVLHARHVRLDEEVAIKVLLPAMLEVAGMTTRFLREAQAASKIKSRHVAHVSDVDVLPDGTPYMIMEYLDGLSLAVLRKQKGTFEIPAAVGMVLEACDAIAEAHALGIVHRDLKPANLFLAHGRDGDEMVKVLDFGISKIDAPGEQDTTKTGQMMGSPKYMAPEQMLSMHDVDGRCDIWSLGAILYDFVAGRTPFVADTVPQLCSLVLHGDPPPPRSFRADLPEELEAVILRCLERDREKRFSTIAELVAALAPFAPAGAYIPPPRAPSSTGQRARSWSSATLPTRGHDGGPSKGPPYPPGEPTAEAAEGAEAPTTQLPSAKAAVHASAPPASAQGGTVSVWDAGMRDRSSTWRRPRTVAAIATAVVLVTAGALAVTMGGPHTPPGSTGAPVAMHDSERVPPAAAEVPSTQVPVPATVAVVEAVPSPGASSTSGPAVGLPPTPAPRARPAKKAAESAPPADPFAGKRR